MPQARSSYFSAPKQCIVHIHKSERFPLGRPVTFRIPCFHLTCWPRASAGRPGPERGPRPAWAPFAQRVIHLLRSNVTTMHGCAKSALSPSRIWKWRGHAGFPGLNYFLYILYRRRRDADTDPALRQRGKIIHRHRLYSNPFSCGCSYKYSMCVHSDSLNKMRELVNLAFI